MAMLRVNNAGKKIGGVYTVQNASFTQEPMEKIAIAGETGSGKSTLMKMIGGHEQISEGEIKFLGRDILGPLDKLISGHPGVAYLSQHFELRNNYFVHELLDYGNKLSTEETNLIFEVCRISHLLPRKTNQLSGGERQRIALAKQLLTAPKLLLLDEPFSNLDAMHRKLIRGVIDDISNHLQTSIIMIAHDAADILSWADKVIVMQAGKIIQQGTSKEVYYYPADEYCAGLFGVYNVLSDALMHQLQALGGADTTTMRVFRPENFILTDANSRGIPVTVQNEVFCGPWYLAEVTAGSETIKVSTLLGGLEKGREMCLLPAVF